MHSSWLAELSTVSGIHSISHPERTSGRRRTRTDADGIEAKLLEQGDVTLAIVRVGNRVRQLALAARLVVDATDVELSWHGM